MKVKASVVVWTGITLSPDLVDHISWDTDSGNWEIQAGSHCL